MLKIVQAPNPVLSQKAKAITKIDTSVKQLIKQMVVALEHAKDPEGVGLAAPQVGKSLQLFIVKSTPESPISVYINPKIESFFDRPKSKEDHPRPKLRHNKDVQLEGCLSLYSIWGVVKRRYGLHLSYQDENGQEHNKKFEGFMATIIQHEYDHLQGALFPKRVLEQENPLYKSVKNKEGEVEFEEIEL